MRRADGVEVGGDDVQTGEGSHQFDPFARGEPAPGRCAHAGCDGGVEDVHVPAEVDRAAGSGVAKFGHGLGEAAAEQVLGGDDAEAEAVGMGEDAAAGGEAADADVPGAGGVDQAFLRGVGELGGGVVAVVGGVGVGVGMAVDVQGDEARVVSCGGAHER